MQAATELGIDLNRSLMVGDRWSDLRLVASGWHPYHIGAYRVRTG